MGFCCGMGMLRNQADAYRRRAGSFPCEGHECYAGKHRHVHSLRGDTCDGCFSGDSGCGVDRFPDRCVLIYDGTPVLRGYAPASGTGSNGMWSAVHFLLSE
mmetsp:Transcript_33879/g.82748  ORF Transcript_33879/g.82748 Transcript_33879/m.82748 type:complete len:101 (+) Transcript_33879:661-963(+)